MLFDLHVDGRVFDHGVGWSSAGCWRWIQRGGDAPAHQVHPAYRRRGPGLALVRCAVGLAREAGTRRLHVDYEPHPAPFYADAGFRHTEAGLLRLNR